MKRHWSSWIPPTMVVIAGITGPYWATTGHPWWALCDGLGGGFGLGFFVCDLIEGVWAR